MDLSNCEQFAEIVEDGLELWREFPFVCFDEGVDGEIDAVKLSQLLKTESHFVVNDVHFSLALLLCGQPGSNHAQNVLDSFQKDSSQVTASPRVFSRELGIGKGGESCKILDTVSERLVLSEKPQVRLENISCSLDVHNCVFSFVSVVRSVFVEHLRNARIVRCSVAAKCPSQRLHSLMHYLTVKTFAEGQVGVRLLQKRKIVFEDVC